VLKLFAAAYPHVRVLLNDAATVLILGLVAALSLYIFLLFVRGVREELAAKKELVRAAAGGVA
jgi:hypothetical protein